MVKHKAEVLEKEYVRRMLDEAIDGMKRVNADNLADLPECVRDAVLRMIALEVVACRMCQSARWN